MKPLILAFLLLAPLSQAKTDFPYANDQWAIDWSEHEIYRGMSAHFGAIALTTATQYVMFMDADVPLWHLMIFTAINGVCLNSSYEAMTEKPGGYFVLMDVAALSGAFAVGGVAQMASWHWQKKIKAMRLKDGSPAIGVSLKW